MSRMATAFSLLSLGLLLGCSETPAPKAAEAAPQPIAHSENRYVMHGSPDKTALLVDSETGQVWRYEGDKLVLVQRDDVEKWVRDPNTGKLVCASGCKPAVQ